MQIRCYNCQKPFMVNKDFIHAALEQIETEHLTHVDVPCPHCRKVNRVSPQVLQRAAPDWKAQSERSPNG
jgi:phage FluMu protein Com